MIDKENLYGLKFIEDSIDQLLGHVGYLESKEVELLIGTCYYAALAHNGQKRSSGEPYICHPIKVAEILAKDVRFNLTVLQAAILHDVIEDTPRTKEDVINESGLEVANLVDGVSKLEKDRNVSPELLQAQTFAKLTNAMAKDPRVVMIKFADRMHNMQTLDSLRPDKRKRIAEETLEVYVPIATKLGMFVFKSELEELSFKHINPWRYKVLEKASEDTGKDLVDIIAVKNELAEAFKTRSINVKIKKRRRNLYNSYKKLKKNLQNKHKNKKTYSIPFILIADSIEECYIILSIIHKKYNPVFRKLTDYIASPKANGYQSIHTSVLINGSRVANFQIRTKDMHLAASAGIVALWRQRNKADLTSPELVDLLPKDKAILKWLKNINNLRNFTKGPLDYYETVKRELAALDIQVFTPKGDVVALPLGATVIDFAYYIHTDLGNHLVSATVNNVKVELDFKLDYGQTVELTTDSSAYPKASWLKKVKSARAKAAIRHFFRSIPGKDLEEIGRSSLLRFMKKQGVTVLNLNSILDTIMAKDGKKVKDLMFDIVLDEVKKTEVLAMIKEEVNKGSFIKFISITALNQPGTLAEIANVISRNNANIETIQLPTDMSNDVVIINISIRIIEEFQFNSIKNKLSNSSFIKQVKEES